MRIANIQSYQNFSSQNAAAGKKTYLDKFSDNVKNSADLNDTITVPRTIFKGYLGIMSGMTLLTLGALAGRFKNISKLLSVSGTLVSMYGTWAFVRPYILNKGVPANQK